MLKSKVILIILVLLILGSFFFFYQVSNKQPDNPNPPSSSSITQPETNSPKIVSTKPDSLEGAVISADQIIEVTFNTPLENDPEFRRRFDPEIEYKLELSSDKKTVRFIPEKPFELGQAYTLFISPETKFVGGGRLDSEKTFHFSTIKYRGV